MKDGDIVKTTDGYVYKKTVYDASPGRMAVHELACMTEENLYTFLC